MPASRLCALIVALAVVAGLFAETSAEVPPAFGPRPPVAGSHPSGTVAFRIKVPSKPSQAPAGYGRARPRYISVSTLSVAVLTDGKNPVVANVSYGFAQVVVHPPAGTHTFTVTAYDGRGAQGNVLSTGTTAPVVVPASGEVRVALTLEGVVARVVLALAQVNPTVGYPATIGLQVTAQDADGNTILGGTPFAQPFTLLSSDPPDATLSQTTIAQATQGITVAYDGVNAPSISFTAIGSGIKAANQATLVPLPPPAGNQLVASGYPNGAFATSGANQIITTFGVPAPAPFYAYTAAAADTAASRLYVVAEYYVNTPNGSHIASRLDIFDTSHSHGYARVGSFQPSIYPESIAIDSAAGTLFASDFFSLDVSVFGTATGHASLGKITTGLCGAPGPNVAIDPTTRRLFVSVDGGDGCGGLIAFRSVPPYDRLGTLATGPHSDVAVDVAGGTLYALEFDDNYFEEFVTVYDTSTLKRVAKIGPFSAGPAAVAVDSIGRRLFLLFSHSELAPNASTVQVYEIATQHRYPLLRTFTAEDGRDLTVAPFTR